MLELRNISKKFGDKQILKDFNLIVPDKQVLAIVGPSGGGKTTLLRMLAGLETIDSGQVIYNGETLDVTELEKRNLLGFVFQDFQLFPHLSVLENLTLSPIYTMNISKEEIIKQGIVSEEDYNTIEDWTRKLFARGQEIAAQKGLILVDTKYEFGKRNGKCYLIDEIHTPDSSRYFYADGYEEKLAKGEPQKQLSKEFVRQWLIEHNFMNEPGQTMPEITDEYAASVGDRYIELYEHITGETFVKVDNEIDLAGRIEKNVSQYLASRK